MALLRDSERHDFATLVVGAGFAQDDFELGEVEDAPAGVEQYALAGHVIVTRKSTGVSRQYSAGHATSWLVVFGDDLRVSVFGRP